MKLPFWISIRKAKDCLFARRNGHVGKIIFGYSVVIKFGKDYTPKGYFNREERERFNEFMKLKKRKNKSP